jgi:hypothetical protein
MEARMIRMLVRHSVQNYGTWRKAYNSFDAERKTMGVVGDDVYQAVDDPNDVTVYHDFNTRQQAETFATSQRLKEVMKNAGVTGQPNIWFVKETN